MEQRKSRRLQPLKHPQLSDEEQKLRVLGIQFGKAMVELEIIERAVPSLRDRFISLGMVIQKLQQEAEAKRVEKETENKGAKHVS